MEQTKDMVNHPAHYAGKVEVIDYLEDKQTSDGHIGYLEGNVIKYVSRWRKKSGLEDLKKAQWYLNRLIEYIEKNNIVFPTEKLWKQMLP